MNKWIFALGMALCVGCSSNSSDSPQASEQNKPNAEASSTSSSSTSSSSSSSSGLTGSGVSEENHLSLSGPDAAIVGSDFVFEYFAFRENTNGGEVYLLATDDSLVLDLTLADFGEFDEADISIGSLSNHRATLNVWPNGMVLRLEKDGQQWLYSLVCDTNDETTECESFDVNEEARTLTIDEAVLQPAPEEGNSATAPVALSGILQWLEADTMVSGKPINNRPQVIGGLPATLADIHGVWDATTEQFGERDEFYLVFDGDTFSEYDYDGDSAGSGDNCYYVETGKIHDLGDGKFNTIDSEGEEEVVSIHVDGENLNLLFLTLKPINRHPSDFVPEC